LAAFQGADVFVCPSVEDGFGLVVTEAMACGLPVVVSDHTGAADLVVPGETGYVVPYNDPGGYARALETLRRDPQRRAAMGRAARAAIQAHTWDHYRQQLVALHRQWLS
jgi:glycosyltransferase involved in cell wall biosynthesis